jgi:hypothetical protein
MRTVLLKIAALIAAAGLVLAACGNPANSEPDRADKTALNAAITAAETERDGTRTSAVNGTDVPLGTKWVTDGVKTAFNAAINAAKGVRDSAGATQSQVNNAVTALNAAAGVFRDAQGNGSAAPVDTGPLDAAITAAKTARDSVVQAEGAGEAAQGVSWATADQLAALNTAITTAETAKAAAVTQGAVSTAVTALNSAKTAFEEAVTGNGPGEKTTGFTQAALDALRGAAEAAKTGVAVSTNGDDIPPSGVWVGEAALTALNDAISAAEGTLADIDSAYLALSSSLADFYAAKQPGTTPDKAPLFAAIISADEAMEGIRIASSAANAPYGSAWITQEDWNALQGVYNDSLEAANSTGAVKTAVDAAVTALNNAVTAFNNAKSANGLGTAAASVAISGLSGIYDDDTEVMVALFVNGNISQKDGNLTGILADGTIANGVLTAPLYSGDAPWTGTGNYYVGFSSDEIFIFVSKQSISFNGLPVSLGYSDFAQYAAPQTLGDLYGDDFTSMTLDAFINEATAQMPGGPYTTYNAWKPAMKAMMEEMIGDEIRTKLSLDYTLYKDAARTQPFSGGDTVTPGTVFYCTAPMYTGGSGGPDRGEQVGQINGTISLTNIPSPAPALYISAMGSDPWWSTDDNRISLTGVSGSSANNVQWTIPLYEGDFYNGGPEMVTGNKSVSFYLYVEPAGSQNGYQIPFHNNTLNLTNKADIQAGYLGTASLASVTLSGTISVALNNQPVPEVRITVSRSESSYTYLTSPAAGAQWAIATRAFDSPTDVSFHVDGYDANGNWLFGQYDVGTVYGVYNANVGNITIALGNINTVTLSGTIDVTLNNQSVPRVHITADGEEGKSSTDLTSPAAGAQWSITLPVPDSPMEVSFHVDGYDANGNWLFDRWDVETVSGVYSANVGNITLSLGTISAVTLSGTVNGHKPYVVEVYAYTYTGD